MVKSKICTKCRKQKLLSEFYKRLVSKDGLQTRCKKCKNADHKRYRQTEKGKRVQSKSDKKYYQAHKVEKAAYYKKYRMNNKVKIYKRNKVYRLTIKGYLYKQFQSMKNRCTNPDYHGYKYYGGQGIKCKFSRDEFVNYVVNELKINPVGLQIHRINNGGHYERGNIEFLTLKKHKELHNGKSNNRKTGSHFQNAAP